MTRRSQQQHLPDLLRERRLELGLPAEPGAWQPTRPLLLLGGLIGAVAVLLSVGSIVLMNRIEARQRAQLQALSTVEQRLQLVEGRLRASQGRAAAVRKDNLQIAETLVAVPTGSPLLEQLRRVTPVGVQLEEVSAQNDRIRLSGTVVVNGPPGPLERINALVLTLARLPISRPDGVKVLQANRDQGKDPVVNFSLDWALDPTARPSIQGLRELGATGLVQRYWLLEQQGVNP